jgi:spore coat protein CotH
VPAHLVYEGRSYGPIGLRLKGQNSFLPFSQKPSLRISVDEYVGDARFFGLKDLTLNNMSGDLTMMHERLAYLVARTAGVPASRANHALLTINDQFYGLYVNVETVKHKMLSRWFENEDGSLFEATDVDFVAGDIADYELEDGPDDRSLLTGLAGALALPGDSAAITAAASYANLGEFQTFWAMCSVIGQFDSFPYSIPGDDYFVYADPTSGRLWFMPWGMDETFYSGSHDVTNVYSVLARRCKAVPSCFQAYVDRTWELVSMTEQMELDGERAEVAAQIAPYVVMDTRKPYSTAQVTAAQNAMHWFISERRAHLAEILPPP